MPGQRSKDIADFVSPRAAYRRNLSEADTVGVASESVPVLDTRSAPNRQIGLGVGGDTNMYGRNAQLNLSLIVSGFSSVTVELWLLANIEIKQLGESVVPPNEDSVPGYSDTSEEETSDELVDDTLEWVFVGSKTITRSSAWTIMDIPPGQYKVMFTALTGTGFLNIREQHAQ